MKLDRNGLLKFTKSEQNAISKGTKFGRWLQAKSIKLLEANEKRSHVRNRMLFVGQPYIDFTDDQRHRVKAPKTVGSMATAR